MINRDTTNDDNKTNHSNQQFTYEIGPDESPSVAVVRAVATFTDTNILNLNPLYTVVDPDHLDGVSGRIGDSTVQTEMSFVFNECEVTVLDQTVLIRSPESESD